MIGQRLGHYRIVEKIGEGGMGVVYRAHDERLDRDIAIKVLSSGLLADEAARKRFCREAQTLAKLNHPHIATVHDFDTQEGVDFLVTEYVPGETLADKLKGGSLPEKEVLRLGQQIAEALAEAHEHNIVHRDLKPQNVKLTPKDQVKILDFGIARLLRPASGVATETFTETQPLAGTLPYMAPEQLRGEGVYARTDIWAAGVVLYEMATVRRAFAEESAPRLIDAILHQPPAPPSRFQPRLSAELERIILKCLEKDPDSRYQSAKELVVDLRRLAAGAGISPSRVSTVSRPRPKRRARRKRIQSLVVLPLTNLSRDPEQEYFADGMTEALISDLAKLRALRIISRTSAMRYKATDKSLPEIAEELNVDAVVEGSVLRVGQRVRITAQLIHATTDTHLWAERYERDLQDVLLLQSEVARAIAREIQLAVTPEETRRLASARRVNPEAHEAYLRGRFHWYKLTRRDLDTAMGYFQLALEKDPKYALAYAGIAYVWLSRGETGVVAPHEAFPKAKVAALEAIELDDTLADVHEMLGNIRRAYEWNWGGAESELQRAIELNPNSAEARLFYADFLISVGRLEEWGAEIERALELDPLNFFIQCFYGWHLVYLRRYDEAILQLRKVLSREANFPAAHLGLWGAFWQKQMYAEALAEAQEFHALVGYTEVTEALARGYAEAGYPGAMRLAAEKLATRSNLTHIPAIRIARLYAHAGEKDRALEWLEKAYEEREGPLSRLSVVWDWDSLRDDPRFEGLLRRMNFPP